MTMINLIISFTPRPTIIDCMTGTYNVWSISALRPKGLAIAIWDEHIVICQFFNHQNFPNPDLLIFSSIKILGHTIHATYIYWFSSFLVFFPVCRNYSHNFSEFNANMRKGLRTTSKLWNLPTFLFYIHCTVQKECSTLIIGRDFWLKILTEE